jgi:general secretion pathway protein J
VLFRSGQDRLILVRTVFADNQPSRLQVISYQINDGVLTRRESAVTRDFRELDALWQSAVNDTDTTPSVTLQSGVASMQMRLWVSGGNSWLPNLGVITPATESAANPPVPTGLEVTMQLRGHNTGMLKIFLLGAV